MPSYQMLRAIWPAIEGMPSHHSRIGSEQIGSVPSVPEFPNPANGATRYVNPSTGRSDNVTREVIHVGGHGFQY